MGRRSKDIDTAQTYRTSIVDVATLNAEDIDVSHMFRVEGFVVRLSVASVRRQ